MFLLFVFVLLLQVGGKFSTKASLDQLRLLLPSKHRQFFDLEAAPSKRRRFFQGIPAEEPVYLCIYLSIFLSMHAYTHV